MERIREIIDWGAKFDKGPDGDYALGKEGGHSEFRILHHKDVTGREMDNISIWTHYHGGINLSSSMESSWI